MDDNRYLIPKKGSDGENLLETRFIVSTSSLENTSSNNKYKPFGIANKLEMSLIRRLMALDAWNPNLYNKDGVFGRHLRQDFDLFLKEYKKEARFVNQKNIFEGEFKRKPAIPNSLKQDGIEHIKKTRQNNGQ